MKKTILVVEDDKSIRELVVDILKEQGYMVMTAEDGAEALERIPKIHPDLVLVDLTLPKLSGESVCRELRRKYPEIAFIILTAKNQVQDVVAGFELGADDYITKPFDMEVLVARVAVRLRGGNKSGTTLSVDDLTLNQKTFEVARGKKTIELSQKEFQLLEYLMANKGHVLSRDVILQKIWHSTDYIEPRVVDVYIGYLRNKIDSGHKHKLIHTKRGFGYMIKASEPS